MWTHMLTKWTLIDHKHRFTVIKMRFHHLSVLLCFKLSDNKCEETFLLCSILYLSRTTFFSSLILPFCLKCCMNAQSCCNESQTLCKQHFSVIYFCFLRGCVCYKLWLLHLYFPHRDVNKCSLGRFFLWLHQNRNISISSKHDSSSWQITDILIRDKLYRGW